MLSGYTPQQKAARLAWWLAQGARLTVEQVATLLYGCRQNARDAASAATRLLRSLAQVLPLRVEPVTQTWYAEAGAVREAFSAEQRGAVLAWTLAHGAALTCHEAAALLHIQRRGAYQMLASLSGSIPIYDDEDTLTWQACA